MSLAVLEQKIANYTRSICTNKQSIRMIEREIKEEKERLEECLDAVLALKSE